MIYGYEVAPTIPSIIDSWKNKAACPDRPLPYKVSSCGLPQFQCVSERLVSIEFKCGGFKKTNYC